MSFPLTGVGVTYNSTSKFGQSLNGGYGYTTTPPVTAYPITIRATVKALSSGNIEVIAGRAGVAWIAKAADNTALAHFGNGNAGTTSGSDITMSSTVNIADGAWHELEINVAANGTSYFMVDGVVVSTSAAVPTFDITNRLFGARAFFSQNSGSTTSSFPFTGELDQLAIFSTVQHSATYTPSTTALTGAESNLAALYSFNGNLLDTAAAGAATALTLSAPSTSVVGSPITVTVGLNGTTSAATTVNLTATDGTFSPTSVSVPASGSATATYTPVSTGAKTLTATDASNTLSPATATTTASAVTAVAYNNTSVYYSPFNWDDRGTYDSSANPGAYAKFTFTGTSVSIGVDVSAMVSASLPSGSYPIIRTIIDGTSSVDTQLTGSTTAVTRSGLASGTHTIELYFAATDIMNGDRWVTPVNAVRITGYTLDSGATISASAKRSKLALFFGDSIWEGYLSNGTVSTQPIGNNALSTVIPLLAKAFDCEYGAVAFSGQGYEQAGNGGAVAFPSAYASYSSGRSRLVSGLFSPAPDYIFVQHGTNGTTTQADVQSMITNLRTAAPGAKIFMIVPANGKARTQITAAVAAIASSSVILIDIGTAYATGINQTTGSNLYSLDGLHPNPLSNALVGAADARAVQAALDGVVSPTLTTRSVSVTLADTSGVLPSLTGLKVAFYDEATPDLHSVPRYKTASGTTDSSGNLAFTVQSTLASGGTGSLVVQMADGRNLVISVVVA